MANPTTEQQTPPQTTMIDTSGCGQQPGQDSAQRQTEGQGQASASASASASAPSAARQGSFRSRMPTNPQQRIVINYRGRTLRQSDIDSCGVDEELSDDAIRFLI